MLFGYYNNLCFPSILSVFECCYTSSQYYIIINNHYFFSTFIPDQEVIQSQEQSITQLLKAVRELSDQLIYQRTKINILEEKVNNRDLSKNEWHLMIVLFGGDSSSITNVHNAGKGLVN